VSIKYQNRWTNLKYKNNTTLQSDIIFIEIYYPKGEPHIPGPKPPETQYALGSPAL